MTFLTSITGKVSDTLSRNTTITALGTWISSSEDVSKYGSLIVSIATDKSSFASGFKIQFSHDNTNWDVSIQHNFKSDYKSSQVFKQEILARYARVSYTNGAQTQTYFRLQTKLHISNSTEQKIEIGQGLIDGFNRLRTSNPDTTLDGNVVLGKNPDRVAEKLTGSGASTHNSNGSYVQLSVATTTGTAMRRTRNRGVYQPGKSQLIYLTGCLQHEITNSSDVATRLGFYDNDDGYYFQHKNGVISIVERSSVSGVVIETIINQTDWNIDGFSEFNPSACNIFFINIEWLGVGQVVCGVVIEGRIKPLHIFSHENALITPYIKTATLPCTAEISGSGGSGRMTQVCYSVISEGGFNSIGDVYSVNMNTTTKSTNTVLIPLIAIRLRSGDYQKAIVNLVEATVASTSNANGLVEVYKFVDSATGGLTGASWTNVNTNSAVEYDIASTAINTTGATLLQSKYLVADADSIGVSNTKNDILGSNIDNVSDVLVVCVKSLANSESFIAELTYSEKI